MKKTSAKAEKVYKKALAASWAIYDKDAAKARAKRLKAAAMAQEVLDKASLDEDEKCTGK